MLTAITDCCDLTTSAISVHAQDNAKANTSSSATPATMPSHAASRAEAQDHAESDRHHRSGGPGSSLAVPRSMPAAWRAGRTARKPAPRPSERNE